MMLSLILPVHNQADHIEAIIRAYVDVLKKLPCEFEILLVENGSTDASVAICDGLQQSDSHIRVLHLSASGWGKAVLAGLAAAQGDMLAYTNSARTRAEDLWILVDRALANRGYVLKANRRLRTSFLRRVGSGLYNLLARTLFSLAVWDVNGTPKVFSRKVYETVKLSEQNDLIDLEFMAQCELYQIPILEIPITSTIRHGGYSTTTFTSGWKMYKGAFVLARRLKKHHPLRV